MAHQEIDPIPLFEQQAIMRQSSGSSKIALEDRALAAYHALWEVDKEQAKIEYFKILKNETRKIISRSGK